MPNIIKTDLCGIGVGISGAALNYQLSYVNGGIRSVFVERQPEVGQLNTHYTQNSQTLHVGDIESNYKDLNKIKQVSRDAGMLPSFFERFPEETSGLYTKVGKMLMGVGDKEVKEVIKRYEWLTLQEKIFPNNVLLNREQIAQIEPALVTGRDPNEQIVAYYSPDGYAINFEQTAKKMVDIAQRERGELTQILLGVGVDSIERKSSNGTLFHTHLADGTIIESKAVVVNGGGFTPVLMKQMGYGNDVGILSIAGNYYRIKPEAQERLGIKNKVYMMQKDGLPFAALHLDPEVDDPNVVRLGPTAFGIPYLEKKKRTSFFDFIGMRNTKHDLATFINMMKNETVRTYIMRNYAYFIPRYGKRLFLKEARKIVPSLTYDDIELFDGYGGTRPQIVDRTTHTLNFGEARILGNNENLIFNITPSPGASTCLGNALKDIRTVLQMPGFEGKTLDLRRLHSDYRIAA